MKETTVNSTDLQMEKLQIEKLKLEIQDLTDKHRWTDRTVRFIPLLSVLITVAGFCFGVYQFREQQKENEAKLLQTSALEITREKRQKIENQLTGFYYPLELRLQKESVFWSFMNYERRGIPTAEKNSILNSQDELLKIMYSHPDVMVNNPLLKGQIFGFVRYAEGVKGRLSGSDFRPNEIDLKVLEDFSILVLDQIPVVEKHYQECMKSPILCTDIIWEREAVSP